MTDKTNFAQSLMHMIKGNLGTGLLAMPVSFAHAGLINATVGLPLLCLLATYCVHLLVRSSQHLEAKMKGANLEYSELAKGAFKTGPNWMRRWSGLMCVLVDTTLIVSQVGICCVYLVFVVDNITSILKTYDLHLDQFLLFLSILPIALGLSFIRTLRRLSIASGCANALQVVGIVVILEYLLKEMPAEPQVENFRPLADVALGFGSAMFAFEGISVILPIYTRMKRPEQVGGCCGIINLSYFFLLGLYFAVGLFGYLKFGASSAASITMNLPNELKYDLVRAVFTVSIFLTYPLQFYVPNEIIWNWLQGKLFDDVELSAVEVSLRQPGDQQPTTKNPPSSPISNKATNSRALQRRRDRYDYLCRTALVLVTFVLAVAVPKLNLVMDLVGSISGTVLSIILPPLIHITAFWEDTSGLSRALMVSLDALVILVGLLASASGSFFSARAILGLGPVHGSPETATTMAASQLPLNIS